MAEMTQKPIFAGVKLIGAFLLGSILTPILSKYVERWAEKLFENSTIRMEACAPLKDARILIRQESSEGGGIIADQKIQHINETTVFVQNKTEKTIKNATSTIYPLSQSSSSPEIWYTHMYASSIKGSSSYEVSKSNSAYQVSIPIFNIDDFILVETKFGEPVGYVVELYSDEISEKQGFETGCADGSYVDASPPNFFYSYYSDYCKKPKTGDNSIECENEISIPFDILEKMRGNDIIVETKISY